MKLISIIIVFIYQINIFANSGVNKREVKFLKIKYEVKKRMSLQSIYKGILYDDVKYSDKYKMVRATKKYNEQVGDWNKLSPQNIFLYVDTSKVNISKLIKGQKLSENQENQLRTKSNVIGRKNQYKYSLFYMASFGDFTQDKNTSKVIFKQNSSFTLGLSLNYKLNIEKLSLSSSLYYSHLDTASANLNFDDVELDAEIGGNLYGNYKLLKGFKLYSGVDYERFNTFNIDRLNNNSEIVFDKNQIVYLTFGLEKLLKILDRNILTKVSYSHSLFSFRSTSSGDSEEEYSGGKFMIYTSMDIYKKFYLHLLYKKHIMTGPSDLDISRFGIGFGYSF